MEEEKPKKKNAAAVALGRRGGKVGGKAQNPAKGFGSMTPERRQEIAQKAVEARRKRKADSEQGNG